MGGASSDVTSLMRQAARFNAGRPAVITPDTTCTFAHAWDRGVRLANQLAALGVRPGDRVAGLEDNNVGAADLFIGCAVAGAVRVPLYPRNSRAGHLAMLANTDCRVALVDRAYADTLA